MSGSSIKVWAAGDILTATDQNTHPMQQQWVVKSANETITSSTTLQNDDHLLISVAASTRYLLEAFLLLSGTSNVGAIKLFWTAPSGSTLDWSPHSTYYNGATSAVGDIDASAWTLSDSRPTAAATANPNNHFACPKGILLTGGSAGTLQFQWAPNNNTGDSAIVRAGSLLRLTRLAA